MEAQGQHYLLCSGVILHWKSEKFVPQDFCQSHRLQTSAQRQCRIFAVSPSLQNLYRAWLPTAWAVSTKPPASSTTAGDPQSPNARGTQGLTLTHHERNWRNLTVPADWAPATTASKQIPWLTHWCLTLSISQHFPFNYKAELILKREGDQICHLGCQGTFKHRGSFQQAAGLLCREDPAISLHVGIAQSIFHKIMCVDLAWHW